MRRTNLLISLIFVSLIFCNLTIYSQIKVVDNKVVIGATSGQDPTHTLEIRGTAHFNCQPAPCGFYFTSTTIDNEHVATLLPQWSNSVRIGDPNTQLFQLFTKYLYVNGVYVTADAKTKENIRPIEKTLDKINSIGVIQFDYKDEYYLKNAEYSPFINEIKKTQKNNVGFLAQDIQKIFPNLVQYSKDDDILKINYLGLIPELTKGIQELSAEIEQLKSEITYLKSNCCNNIDKKSNELSNNAILYQNTPNPFTNNTNISFYIPKSVKVADLYIYNLSGTQIKHSLITAREEGSYTLNANELEAGMYIYTLVNDNTIIDSKRMILTK